MTPMPTDYVMGDAVGEREHAEFKPPATLVGRGPPHRSALWSEVPYRRQVWIRGLTEGAVVHVLDDCGNVFETTVRGLRPMKHGPRSKEPQVWFRGCVGSYAAGRIFKPGRPLT